MNSVQKESFACLLNALGEVAVFVVCQDTQEILFCNEEAKRKEEVGEGLKEQWKKFFYCFEEAINKDENYVKTIIDETAKQIMRMSVTKIAWGTEGVPAFSIVFTPILKGEGAEMHFNFFETLDVILAEGYVHSCVVNLTKNEYSNILPDFYSDKVLLHGTSYDEMVESLSRRIHPIHGGQIKEVYRKERLIQEYKEGNQRISRDYLLQNEKGGYRWVRGSVILQKSRGNADVKAVMLWREIEAEKGFAQQLLMEQEALFDSLPGYVLKIAVGEEITFLEASRTFYDFFGEMDDNYHVGDNVFTEDQKFVVSEIKEKGKLGQSISFECRVCNKEGKIVWAQCEGKLVGHQMGKSIYLMILLDITNIKKAQAQLMQERERYRLAVVNMADGIFEYYVNEDLFLFHSTDRGNRGTLKIRNYVKNIKELPFFTPEAAALLMKILRGESTGSEMEIALGKHRQKEWFFCQGNPIFQEGEVKKVVGTFRSIDRVKRAQLRMEEELQVEQKKYRMSNQRFLQVVNQLYDLIIEVDIKNRKTYIWKDAANYISLIPKDETLYDFLTTAGFDFIHCEYRELAREKFSLHALTEELHKGKKEVMLEVPGRNSMGIYRWYRIQAQLIEEDAHSFRVMVYFKDIDEQKSRETLQQSALEDALRLAERANAAKSEFLSRMSHDIRTPLNAIMGMLSIAEANLDCRDKMTDCLSKINSSSKYLLTLINDILDMSKIESGKMPINTKEFDIHELLQEAVVYGYTQAQMKEQEFFVQIKGEAEEVFMGDSLRINQILINLLSNAFKYTWKKGEVSLTAEVKPLDEGNILLQLEVRDNGIGIQKSFLEKLFVPFEQGEGGLKFGGTGLGLAISQNLAMLMGGQIFVESDEGKGSIFRAEIPLKRKTETTIFLSDKLRGEKHKNVDLAVVGDGTLYNIENIRVLLVEDNEMNVEIVKTLLEMCNITVDVARNGLECTALFQQSEVDTYLAILMDVQMPVMNGCEATRIIRKMNRLDARRIPIIAMTANIFSSDIGEVLAAGMTEHIPKPIDMSVLLNLLRGYEEAKNK